MHIIDQKLISALKVNARQSISSLAADLGMARTTVQSRLTRLEQTGVIAGYGVILGENLLHPQIEATVLLKLDLRAGASVVSRLKSIPNVEEAFSTSGRFDLVLQIVAETTTLLDQVLDKIGEMKGVHSSESLIKLSVKIKRRS